MSEDQAKEYINEWPNSNKNWLGGPRAFKTRNKPRYTAGEIAFQVKLEAWEYSRRGEWESVPENPMIPKSWNSSICACGHEWISHRRDGVDRHDTACFALRGDERYCQCESFRKAKKPSRMTQDKTFSVGPYADTSDLTLARTGRELAYCKQYRYYRRNREKILAKSRAYYLKRKAKAKTETPA